MVGRAALSALFLVVLVAAAAPAEAADANRQYSVRGRGTHSCSDYIQASQEDEKASAQYADWLTGFFTAYNMLQPDTYDIAPLAKYKQSGLVSFLDLYCGQHPDKKVIDAAVAFVNVNYDKRDKSRP